jgi:hypothetical protein
VVFRVFNITFPLLSQLTLIYFYEYYIVSTGKYQIEIGNTRKSIRKIRIFAYPSRGIPPRTSSAGGEGD